jgi:PIN domain nuclease of toxin-antitoxin system
MRLLLDTQIFIWAAIESPRLSSEARSLILEAEESYISSASIWEIAIKARLGKIEMDAREMVSAIEESGFFELPISAAHAAAVSDLTLHHHDPFDRLLVAQALSEPLRLITADPFLPRYSDLVILV